MRIVVFSDIHGNALALEAMLADLKGEAIDQMVCLGDAIQGGPQPLEVVMGNADDWLLSGHDSGAEQIGEERLKKMEAVRQWQLAQLSESDLAFIQDFKPTVDIGLPGGQTLLCYHGPKKSFDDVILPTTPEEEVRQFLEPEPHIIYCGGHTHMQFVRHFGRTFHFNPGSVGFAYRHDQPDSNFRADPWAEYALLTCEQTRLRLEFRRLPFEVSRLIEIYRASGRPYTEEAIEQYGPI